MMRLGGRKQAPLYDLFKLIIAVILIVILFILLWQGRQQFSPLSSGTATQKIATEMPRTLLPSATAKIPIATSTPQPPPAAVLPTATNAPSASPTPGPTSAPTTTASTSNPGLCPSAPTRIQVGNNVRVLHWLYLRTGPGLNSPIILTNGPGTIMQVIGGPVCTPRSTAAGSGAYLWWNVHMQNGREGWSAEAPLIEQKYFLEPIR